MGITLDHRPLVGVVYLSAVQQRGDQRLERIVDDAHEWADDAELCEKFDEFMKEHGLRTRKRDFDVDIDVSFSISVQVQAFDANDARDQLDQGDVDSAAIDYIRHCMGGESWTITDVMEA